MSKKHRILGLLNLDNEELNKLLYIHSNFRNEICVNGEPSSLFMAIAGEIRQPAVGAGKSGYAMILPPGTNIEKNRFFAVGPGESMLWVGENELKVVNPGFIGVSSRFEFWRPIRTAVLTVSDKGSRNERVDTAGPALADLAESIGSEVVLRDIVPDDRETISKKLESWCGEGIQLILVTGGTGFSERDVTPEAIIDISERMVPGFGEAMRTRSMFYTERGFLTRSIAGIKGKTLIISFPGSERAVRQCFEAIAPALRHGVETLSGWDAECGSQ